MFESGIWKALTALFALIIFLSILRCSTARKNVRTVSCSPGSELILTVEKEFVELSYEHVYDLAYKKNSDENIRIATGNISILPEAKRYKDMISVRDFTPGRAKSLFQYHYLFPSEFTAEEFKEICDCYGNNRESFPELDKKIGALVYGDYNLFREVFKLSNGFYIVTEHNGDLTITDDPSRMAMTIPAEKRHFNNIGYFDDHNRLHLRRGRIISDIFNGFYGKPVKQVELVTGDGKVDYTAEIETLWCDILFSSERTGIDTAYLLSAVNDKGKRLDEIFEFSAPQK